MNIPISKLLITIVIGFSTFYFTFWFLMSLITTGVGFLRYAGSGIIALGACWFFWNSKNTMSAKSPKSPNSFNGAISSIFRYAFIFGAICFVPGFVGPLIFMPENNLGPLMGILGTGPVGFLIGAIFGFVRWIIYREQESDENST